MLKKIFQNMSFTYPSPRKLREIMQMSLIERESPRQIKYIWQEYHEDKSENIAMTFEDKQYENIQGKLTQSPLFLFPIKRKGGHFMLISQKQDNSILMTFLEEFKTKRMFANPYFILTFFEELKEKKNLVLLRGDIMDMKITKEEARMVTKDLFKFYMNEELYFKYVYSFNNNQSEFNYDSFKELVGIA